MTRQLWERDPYSLSITKEVRAYRRKRLTKGQLASRFNVNSKEVLKGMGLNLVQIIGNLGADPEMRFTPSGSPVTNFRVAASRRWNDDKGQTLEQTEWFYVVTWNRVAENCNQYLQKGSMVYIQGRLQTRTWDDQKGEKHYRTEVIANSVQFLKGGASALESPDAAEIVEELGELGVEAEVTKPKPTKRKPAAKSSRNVKVVKKGGG